MLWRGCLVVALLCLPALSAEARDEAHAARADVEAGKEAAAAAAEPVKAEELNMDQLIERLKNTDSIGFITKLAIRSDVMDFKTMVDRCKKRNELEEKKQELRSRFDGLMLKILALLEKDPQLSEAIYTAKETIWKSFVEMEA